MPHIIEYRAPVLLGLLDPPHEHEVVTFRNSRMDHHGAVFALPILPFEQTNRDTDKKLPHCREQAFRRIHRRIERIRNFGRKNRLNVFFLSGRTEEILPANILFAGGEHHAEIRRKRVDAADEQRSLRRCSVKDITVLGKAVTQCENSRICRALLVPLRLRVDARLIAFVINDQCRNTVEVKLGHELCQIIEMMVLLHAHDQYGAGAWVAALPLGQLALNALQFAGLKTFLLGRKKLPLAVGVDLQIASNSII